jgi:hypothetical protein
LFPEKPAQRIGERGAGVPARSDPGPGDREAVVVMTQLPDDHKPPSPRHQWRYDDPEFPENRENNREFFIIREWCGKTSRHLQITRMIKLL